MKSIIAVLIGLAIFGGGYYFLTLQQSGTSETVQTDIQEAPMPVTTLPVDSGTTSATTTPPTDTPSATGAETASATKEFSITNSGFVFSEKVITVNKGDKVKITYKNGGGTHDFRIEGYNVGTKVIKTGEMETIEFTADTAGDFEFYCSVGNHRAMGMKGTFTVK